MILPNCARVSLVAITTCLLSFHSPSASATHFCYVKQASDGYVALRREPRVGAPEFGRMKSGDEVQLGLGQKGKWIEVYWWRGDDRLAKGFHAKAGHGWVVRRYIEDECG